MPMRRRTWPRRLAALALLGLAIAACGRRIDLPEEPPDTGIPEGEIAYVKKYRWDAVGSITDIAITRDQVLFAVQSDSVVSYFSDRATPRFNTSRAIPQLVIAGGDTLSRPVQICEGADQHLWVAYMLPLPTVVQFDLRKTPQPEVDSLYVQDGGILEFGGLAADPDSGYVYASDPQGNTITKYQPGSRGGRRVTRLATVGNGDHFVQQPHGLFFFHDSLLVADTGKNWLQVIATHAPLTGRGQVRGPTSKPLTLSDPRDVWVDANGVFYVADAGNGRILQINTRGEVKENVTELDGNEAPAVPITFAANNTEVWVPDLARKRLTIYQINTVKQGP